jgi:hypothetical protein
MSLINISAKHGVSPDEARANLQTAVQQVQSQFGPMIQKVAWSPARERVRLDGIGFWVEMWVDAFEVHATGDIPAVGKLFGGPLAAGLKGILRSSFKQLT